jgi:hypothetical protein
MEHSIYFTIGFCDTAVCGLVIQILIGAQERCVGKAQRLLRNFSLGDIDIYFQDCGRPVISVAVHRPVARHSSPCPVAPRLQYEGFRVDMQHDGVKGLTAALGGGYDLMVLDVMLPGMDGFEILRRVRRESRLPARTGTRTRTWVRRSTSGS